MPNYVLLNRQTLTASAASVTFSSIPQTGYTDLKIVISTRYSNAISMGGFGIYLNGVTTNQSGKYILGTGSAVSSGSGILVDSDGASDTAKTFSSTEIYIPNYTSSNYKSLSIDNVSEANATYAEQIMTAGLWSSTAAITSVGFARGSASWDVGSSFSLYGIAAVGTNPASGPKAAGGDTVISDGTYWYHTFLSTGAFTPKVALTCDYLVVAGGGAGGSGLYNAGSGANGGGGGAGGYRTSLGGSALSLSANTSYTAFVGAGGASAAQNGYINNGTNSSFASITATGGGGGAPSGYNIDVSAGNGGSGGGGSSDGQAPLNAAGTGNAGGYSPVEGYGGGTGSSAAQGAGGGGGGAGGAGTNAGGTTPGAGGAGSNSASALATATGTGVSGYYAGGGGGSGNVVNGASYTPGAGGSGGGGAAGSNNNSGGAGTANTGGGGGASSGSGATSGQGGSGIVIIRYAV